MKSVIHRCIAILLDSTARKVAAVGSAIMRITLILEGFTGEKK